MWEYKLLSASLMTSTALNEYGSVGWELVAATGNTLYLKRRSGR